MSRHHLSSIKLLYPIHQSVVIFLTITKIPPIVLFFNPVQHATSSYEQLQKLAQTELITSTSREEFYADLEGKYHNISIIYRTSASGTIAGPFDADFISHLPPTCKFICHNGAGYDQIDASAFTSCGITVTYAPDPVTDATADLAIWLMLSALQQLNPSLESLRRGSFKKGLPFGRDPQGQVLGLLGMGRIGWSVVKRAEGFGVVARYHNRRRLSEEEDRGAEYVSFERLLGESDIISLHVPLNEHTRGLIGEREISQMKDGVVVVNTSRGAVIDEAAMAEALDSGKIAAVGFDVYEKEPVVNEKLIKNNRALMVPHLGTHTVETLGKMEEWAMENVRRAVLGEDLL